MKEETIPLKKTPLVEIHEALGAKMAAFAGYWMPIYYSGIQSEHRAVRNAAGIFDCSHMGEFVVSGPQAEDFLQYVTLNDVSKLHPGKAQYTLMANHRGGTVDDLLLYRLEDDRYLLVVNASNIQKDWQWLQQHSSAFEVEMEDISDQTALIAVQGPRAHQLLEVLLGSSFEPLRPFHFMQAKIGDVEPVTISATGYTGSGGYELYMPSKDAPSLWNALLDKAHAFNALPAGLGARDTLRLEMGYCLYGHELTEEISALEAGLSWVIKWNKGDFIGKEALLQQRKQGIKQKLSAFYALSRRVPRAEYSIVDADGATVGWISSGTLSPCLQRPIALGFIPPSMPEGQELYFRAGNKMFPLQQTVLPFYKGDCP